MHSSSVKKETTEMLKNSQWLWDAAKPQLQVRRREAGLDVLKRTRKCNMLAMRIASQLEETKTFGARKQTGSFKPHDCQASDQPARYSQKDF